MDKSELIIWLYEQKDKVEQDRVADTDYITHAKPKDSAYYAKIETFERVIAKVKSM